MNSKKQVSPIFLPSLLALAMVASVPAAQSASTALTDGQVLQVVRTLNDGEIEQAELALDKTDDAQVQSVAEMIKTEHEVSNENIETIEDENDELDLDDSDTSESLAATAEETREGLKELDGAQFACTYLLKQEEGHQRALDTISQLEPTVTNSSVKAFLASTTPVVEHHIELAKTARESLADCGG